MNINRFLHSLINLVVALFFLVIGVVCFILPWSSTVREGLVAFLKENNVAFFLFGLGFIIIGTVILINIILNTKRRQYYIRSGKSAVAVDEKLIQTCLEGYWKQVFPKSEIPIRLTIKHNKIHVTAEFPEVPFLNQKSLLERIERDLKSLFEKVLGYQDEFFLSASFQSPKETTRES